MPYLKKALISEEGHPVGVPAPMYLICICGTKVPMPGPHAATCPKCGTKFDGAGWIIER